MLQIITTQEELQETIDQAVSKAVSGLARPEEQKLIHGLKGLAEFLGCGEMTAFRLKKTLPHYQSGRIVVFKPDEVLAAMAAKKKRK
ncbi:MAG: DUF3853 family protein [Prolixibacteraceae bacterium]